MATAQINARIDSDLKLAGDRALDSVGFTPTRAIRALWQFAGKHLHDQKALRALLETLEDSPHSAQRDEADERQRRVREGPQIFNLALREMGIEDARPLDISDDELLEQAHLDKMVERGLL